MLALFVVLSVVCFFVNFVMDRYFITDIHRQDVLGITSMLFWLAGAAFAAISFVSAIRSLGV